ncbi:RidA family protein [Haliangium sp.]|uniref:RidA family protein n=1 Tax=Haliangium sp. TaxID=2663208 RepID=UPI003D0C4CF8
MSGQDGRGHRILQPEGWAAPKGYVNGVAARGTTVFVAGQIGWDPGGALVGPSLVEQTTQALRNITAVLAEAGAGPEHLVRLTWYVTDMDAYRGSLRELGRVYRDVMGRHYPTMALVQVVSLVEPGAVVEIEATAVVPEP